MGVLTDKNKEKELITLGIAVLLFVFKPNVYGAKDAIKLGKEFIAEAETQFGKL